MRFFSDQLKTRAPLFLQLPHCLGVQEDPNNTIPLSASLLSQRHTSLPEKICPLYSFLVLRLWEDLLSNSRIVHIYQ